MNSDSLKVYVVKNEITLEQCKEIIGVDYMTYNNNCIYDIIK